MPQTLRDRILVVESDPVISDLVARQALQAAGYQVQVVGDASAAISRAIQLAPDIIVVNLDLPGLSGKDLMVALNSQGVQIPVIVIGKKGGESEVIQAFRVGAADYLLWPLREAEVIAVVERVLKLVRERRERERLAQQLQQANQEMQLRVRELTTIFAVGKAVISITDQALLFDRILEGAAKASQADVAWLLLRDEARKNTLLVAHRNLPPSLAERINQPWDDGISSLVAISGEPLSIYGESLKRFKIISLGQSALIVPIKIQKQVMGLLAVMRRQPTPFSSSEQHLLEAICDYAAIALANARLFRSIEERSQSLQSRVDSAQMGEKIGIEIMSVVKDQMRPPVDAARQSLERITNDPGARWTAEQRQAIAALQEAVLSLGRITEAINPPETDPAGQPSSCNLNDLLRQAVERAQVFAHQNDISMNVETGAQSLSVAGDSGQLAAVMDGLLSNAIKFTHPGGRVFVRLEQTRDGLAHITVTDSGPGIDPRLASRLFEAGQPSAAVSRRFGGIGIRLYLIKSIVSQHKGKVWVESKIGQGATFHLTLPLLKS